MTQDEFKAQLQVAQDMIRGLENQRNASNNENVQLAAQIMALQRKVAELEKTAPASANDAEAMPAPVANGHAEAQAAVN